MASILCWKWSGALRFYHLSLRSIMWGWQCGWFYSLTLSLSVLSTSASLFLCGVSSGSPLVVQQEFVNHSSAAAIEQGYRKERERERERKRKREVWGKKKRKQTSEGNRKKRSRRKRRERERERSDKKENVLSLFFVAEINVVSQ